MPIVDSLMTYEPLQKLMLRFEQFLLIVFHLTLPNWYLNASLQRLVKLIDMSLTSFWDSRITASTRHPLEKNTVQSIFLFHLKNVIGFFFFSFFLLPTGGD